MVRCRKLSMFLFLRMWRRNESFDQFQALSLNLLKRVVLSAAIARFKVVAIANITPF